MSAEMVSGPGALPALNDLRTILSSDIVNGAEHSTAGEGLDFFREILSESGSTEILRGELSMNIKQVN